MAWPGQPDAEKIIGMKPEELKAKLDGAATKEDFTKLDTSVNEFKSSLQQIQESLKALSTPPVVEEHTESGDPVVENLTDPVNFVGKQLKPIQEAQLATQAQIMEMRARQSPQFSGVFAQYGDELVKSAATMNVATRGGERFWEWHIRTFLGDKFVRGELKGTSYPSLLGTSTAGVNANGETKDANHGLDADVADFLKTRGVDPEKAGRIKHLMVDQGEPISLETYRKTNAQA